MWLASFRTRNNLLKPNPEKYNLLVSTNEKRHLNVGEVEISNSKCETFQGIKIDSKLMFDSHVKSLCKKASQKLNALSRVAYQLDFNQRKLLMNAFITSQFSYAPVVWMFHSRKQNHHINRIMKGRWELSIKIIILHLMNFLKKITLIRLMTETFENW